MDRFLLEVPTLRSFLVPHVVGGLHFLSWHYISDWGNGQTCLHEKKGNLDVLAGAQNSPIDDSPWKLADKATDAGPSSISTHTCHRRPGQWCPVPIDDIMQLFANAWMNHFKTLSLAHNGVPPWTSSLSPTPQYNTQKCIRAGSKHNDLDAMGNSTP
uniref:Alanyl-tRNA synthetase, cytoplasmic n=1 Tax=Aegilops tauschii TaxID=37682 RepID=M8BVF1_AEGTA